MVDHFAFDMRKLDYDNEMQFILHGVEVKSRQNMKILM